MTLQEEPSLPDTDSELRVACHFWNLIQDHYTGFTYRDKRTENDTLNRIAADIKEIKARFAQSAVQEVREENDKLKENDLYLRKLNSDLTKQLADALEEAQEAREKAIEEILLLNDPWSLISIIENLIQASTILLDEKNYDGHGWEFLSEARIKAEDFLLNLKEKK